MLPPNCEHFRSHFEPRSGIVSLHRRECPSCAVWAARLETFLEPPAPRPLPARLRSRLMAIATPPPLPWWIRDGSAALAASLVLALGLSLLIDVRWLGARAASFEADAARILELGNVNRRAAATKISQTVEVRREAVSRSLETLSGRLFELRDFIRQEASELYEHAVNPSPDKNHPDKNHPQGDEDGKP